MTADLDLLLDEEMFLLRYGDLIEELIERDQLQVPDTFVPSAKHFAVGSHELLWLADPRTFAACTRRPRNWVNSGRDGSLQTIAHSHFLWVRPFDVGISSKKLWYIERQRMWQPKS